MSEPKKIVLIVDDSPLVIDRLHMLLEGSGSQHSVLLCRNFQQAIATIDQKNMDVAVLDISLPDGNGINLLKHIKKTKPSLPVIMLTNQATDFHRKLCLQEGAADFIDKSAGFDRLPAIIDSVLVS